MPKIDLDQVPVEQGSRYPAPYDEPCRARRAQRLALAAGLEQFGVNLVTLPPGAWSSQRHWHGHEDEFVYVVSGELVLIDDDGETAMAAGDCAGFKGGERNGHHLVNRSGADAVFLAVGSRLDPDFGEYPDIDMKWGPGRYTHGGSYTRKNGDPFG